jgi:bifunctional DNA-binding transcriptional regulator/antitoxin component of YhaV-PrlF toxin-antitoxin module
MGKIRMDEPGRILIPSREREKPGLKSGTKLLKDKGISLLKPIIPEPVKVKSKKGKWGKKAFLDSREATFGG